MNVLLMRMPRDEILIVKTQVESHEREWQSWRYINKKVGYVVAANPMKKHREACKNTDDGYEEQSDGNKRFKGAGGVWEDYYQRGKGNKERPYEIGFFPNGIRADEWGKQGLASTGHQAQPAMKQEKRAKVQKRKHELDKRMKQEKRAKVQKRKHELDKRIDESIRIEKERLGNVPLSRAQTRFWRERLQIEHKQELACMGYLNGAAIRPQARLYAPNDTVNPADPRCVITDVLQRLSRDAEVDLRLRDGESVHGLPWEVKDCDGMNPTEHAHGQSDYQRTFANCKKGSLWLFTEDSPSSKGRQNFAVLCETMLLAPVGAGYNKDRYDKVILARRLKPYDCEEVSMEAAKDAIIATWNSSDETIVWKRKKSAQPPPPPPLSTPQPDRSLGLPPLVAQPVPPLVAQPAMKVRGELPPGVSPSDASHHPYAEDETGALPGGGVRAPEALSGSSSTLQTPAHLYENPPSASSQQGGGGRVGGKLPVLSASGGILR